MFLHYLSGYFYIWLNLVTIFLRLNLAKIYDTVPLISSWFNSQGCNNIGRLCENLEFQAMKNGTW